MIKNLTTLCAIAVLATLLAGCNPQANDLGSSLSLVEPADGQQFQVGELIKVRSMVVAADGASSVELLVNGQPVRKDQPNQAVRIGFMWQPWQAAQPGLYTLQTRILTASGTTLNSARINIVVGANAAGPALLAATPVSVTAANTITPTLTPTETIAQAPAGPMATAPQDDNCRYGPGMVYSVAGYLLSGQSSRIVGRNAESTWWVIERVDGSGTCWIWDEVVTVSGDTSRVPVATPPAPPTDTPSPQPEPAAVPIPIGPNGSLTCRSTVFLKWQPVNQPNGVDHYEWQVTGIAQTKQGTTAGTSAEFVVTCGKSYKWRVRAVDGSGVPGPYSAAMPFTIQ